MKRLSEVSHITGASRRTLQGLAEKEIVLPSAKTEAGYWLYDDEAIQKIIGVQMLMEVGYSRDEIKRMLGLPITIFNEELDKAIEKLENKRKRIDGMIKNMKVWKMVLNVPDEKLNPMIKGYEAAILEGKLNFKNMLNEMIDEAAETSEKEFVDQVEDGVEMYTSLISIGLLHEKTWEDEEVQNKVQELYCYFLRLLARLCDIKLTEVESRREDFVEIFRDNMIGMITDVEEIRLLVSSACGIESISFIEQAIRYFVDLIAKK